MDDLKTVLERSRDRMGSSRLTPEGVSRRREHKQRNRRIRAGAVGLIVAIAAAAALARSFESGRVPADRPTPLGAGEVLNVMNHGVDTSLGDLVAEDPNSGHEHVVVDAEALPGGCRNGCSFGNSEDIRGAAWSFERRWVAFRAGGLWVADTVGGVPQQLTADQGWDPWAWSPTEDRLTVVQGQHMTLVNMTTGQQRDLGTVVGSEDIEGNAVHVLAWSADGTRIVYDGGPGWGSVYSIDVKSGDHTLLVRQPAGMGAVTDIDWSPDGAHLAIRYELPSPNRAEAAEALYLANADGSYVRLADRIAPHGHNASHWTVWQPGQNVGTAWSPDGTRFAYSSLAGPEGDQELQVRTFSVDGSVPTLVASRCCEVEWASPVWSPDGAQLAFGTLDSSLTEIGRSGAPRYLVVNGDGTGDAREIDGLTYQSWAGGWYFCFCYG